VLGDLDPISQACLFQFINLFIHSFNVRAECHPGLLVMPPPRSFQSCGPLDNLPLISSRDRHHGQADCPHLTPKILFRSLRGPDIACPLHHPSCRWRFSKDSRHHFVFFHPGSHMNDRPPQAPGRGPEVPHKT